MALTGDDSCNKTRILAVVSAYPPISELGGPAVSVSNIAELLHDRAAVEVLTLVPRRLRGTYGALARRTTSGPRRVWFSSSVSGYLYELFKGLRRHRSETLYLNGLFSPLFGLLPSVLAIFMTNRSGRLIVAPRGELQKGALANSGTRKTVAIQLLRILYRAMRCSVTYHASSREEAKDISNFFPNMDIRIATNLPSMAIINRRVQASPRVARRNPRTTVLFLSRLDSKKNLHGLLKAFALIDRSVRLVVAGDESDRGYASRCKTLADGLPGEIEVEFLGHSSREDVPRLLNLADVVAIPTFGENFGHALWETLSSGRPLLTGEEVIWKELEASNAGWNVDPHNTDGIASALRQAIEATPEELWIMQLAARAYAEEFVRHSEAKREHLELFFP